MLVYESILYLACLLVLVENCPFKVCHCERKVIKCGNRGLTTIPPLTGQTTVPMDLMMENNNINQVPAGKLPPNLLQIDFSQNPILTIDDSAFDDSQNTLRSLSFLEASFTRIPDALLHLKTLTSFTIYNTWIQDWNENAMNNIALTVQDLYLVNVSLHMWPTWLQNFTHLTELGLDSNVIVEIPDDAFDMVSGSLQVLNLRNNNLTSVPKALSKLTALTTLLIDNNKLSYTKWLPLSSTLVTLSLTNTHLVDAQSLSNDVRSFAKSLSSINLDNNNLAEIPDFSFLSEIGYLDFSYNRISNSRSGSLHPSLSTLTLDHNFLSAVPNVFINLTSLQTISMVSNIVRKIIATDIPFWIAYIDFTSNLITELTDTSFPLNSSITSLTLDSNPIVSISQNAFKNLPLLMFLNLENTKLTRLPLALAWLTSLEYFSMDDNANLVCTCQEKSLASWVLSRQTSIDSSCGEASISYFFEYLSPFCP